MSGNECPAPGCTTTIKRHLWACSKHWFQLPVALRRSIWSSYRANTVLDTIDVHLDESMAVWDAKAKP